MRPKERIDNFLKLVDWGKLFNDWKIPLEAWGKVLNAPNDIEDYWTENPDQRIGQVLINLGLVPDDLKIWIQEEEDILIDQGVAPEDCLYWTSYYDANMQLLPEPITRLVKELEPDHIHAIFEMCRGRLSKNYITAFDNVLDKKENE